MADICSSNLGDCRNEHVALHLKVGAIVAILIACIAGVGTPFLGRSCSALRAESTFFFIMKSFAAGVILATGFVHMLPDAFDSLTNPCLPEDPWSKFPFAGFVAMMAALLTLLIDFWGTAYYEKKHTRQQMAKENVDGTSPLTGQNAGRGGNLTLVSVHSHGSSLTHPESGFVHPDTPDQSTSSQAHFHSHHFEGHDSDESLQLRHRVISQVLELGIVAHSVIIGISLGTSQSPCTIRPLIAALTFHQFFEGMALGGCIVQARFKSLSAAIMGFFFTITTPGGIAIGIAVSSSYNENSPTALIVEGVFDSMSAGILVYMSLVDLIATDFLSKKMQSDHKLQFYCYTALFLGAGAMSLIAYWA